MQRKTFIALIFICAIAALVFFLNSIALEHFLYWKYWWYDIMMHGLGGLVIGSGITWFFIRTHIEKRLSYKQFFYVTIILVLAIGIGWEIMEYTNGLYVGQPDIVADTIQDLCMDILGGVVAWFVLSRFLAITPEPETVV